jgi:hypothetical protein
MPDGGSVVLLLLLLFLVAGFCFFSLFVIVRHQHYPTKFLELPSYLLLP